MADTPTSAAFPPGDETPGYEEARDELAEVVRRLEAGDLTLEESLSLWERGETLARICQVWLDGARARINGACGSEDTARGRTNP